jgi:hypothetical protein
MENLVNDFTTTLGVAATAINSVLYVNASPSVLPKFRARIDNELVLVTQVSSNQWTVDRGIEGTAAAAHALGAQVSVVITAGGMNEWLAQSGAPAIIRAKSSTSVIGHSFAHFQIDDTASPPAPTSMSTIQWASSQQPDQPFDLVFDYGANSTTIQDAIASQLPSALADNSEILWVITGINNLNPALSNNDSLNTIVAQAKILLDQASPLKVAIIWDSITPIAQSGTSGARPRANTIPLLNSKLKALCESYKNVIFNDVYPALVDPTSYTADPIGSPSSNWRSERATFGTIATTGTQDSYVIAPDTGILASVDFSCTEALAASDTNYITFTLTNLGQSGSGTTAMLATSPAGANTTKTTGGTTWTAGKKITLLNSTDPVMLKVQRGDRIRLRAAVAGTLPNALTLPVWQLRLAELPATLFTDGIHMSSKGAYLYGVQTRHNLADRLHVTNRYPALTNLSLPPFSGTGGTPTPGTGTITGTIPAATTLTVNSGNAAVISATSAPNQIHLIIDNTANATPSVVTLQPSSLTTLLASIAIGDLVQAYGTITVRSNTNLIRHDLSILRNAGVLASSMIKAPFELATQPIQFPAQPWSATLRTLPKTYATGTTAIGPRWTIELGPYGYADLDLLDWNMDIVAAA